jgi:chromosome condensin MukBEF MukE localization factor
MTVYAEDLCGLLSYCLVRFSNMCCVNSTVAGAGVAIRETKSKLVASIAAASRDGYMPALEGLDIKFPITHDFGRLFHEVRMSDIPMESGLKLLREFIIHVLNWTSCHRQTHKSSGVPPEKCCSAQRNHRSEHP